MPFVTQTTCPPFLTMTAHAALSALSYLANHAAGVTTGLTPIRFSPGTSRLHQPHTAGPEFRLGWSFCGQPSPATSHVFRTGHTETSITTKYGVELERRDWHKEPSYRRHCHNQQPCCSRLALKLPVMRSTAYSSWIRYLDISNLRHFAFSQYNSECKICGDAVCSSRKPLLRLAPSAGIRRLSAIPCPHGTGFVPVFEMFCRHPLKPDKMGKKTKC